MGDILIRAIEDSPWQLPADDWPGKVAAEAPQVKFRILCEGTSQLPDVRLVEYEPGHHEAAHSHGVTEALYILQGEIDLGGTTVAAGTLVVIEQDTAYGPLQAGRDGARFLRVAGIGKESVPRG